ncbi:MAG TPA: conjugal transfer protein TraF [Vicinamibacterales bacterium]|nr:conjugal transfer protein TraF [Vicinamibacterales bacterium]
MPHFKTLARSLACCGVLAIAHTASAQAAGDPAGVRAAGMGDAFVAVADDASAVYWNPAGLASGAYFSLVLDRNALQSTPSAGDPAFRQSALLFAAAMPALGLSYYRTHEVSAIPEAHRLTSLITHNAGVTLVQSLGGAVAVGTTLRVVRGVAGIATVADATTPDALDRASDVAGAGRTKFDADLGVMATGGAIHVGLTIRNLLRPAFPLQEDANESVRPSRQVRAGLSFSASRDWTVAVDADLTKRDAPAGPWRDAAIGAEGHIASRAWIRGGVRWNTAGSAAAPAASLGASLRLTESLLIDAQATAGSAAAGRGWGIGTRVMF